MSIITSKKVCLVGCLLGISVRDVGGVQMFAVTGDGAAFRRKVVDMLREKSAELQHVDVITTADEISQSLYLSTDLDFSDRVTATEQWLTQFSHPECPPRNEE